jgi:hypothetical protein
VKEEVRWRKVKEEVRRKGVSSPRESDNQEESEEEGEEGSDE